MIDRVLELRSQINSAMELFDAAAERRDEAAAANQAERAAYLDKLYASTIPTTPHGAADKIRDAIGTLRESVDPMSQYCAHHLNPIARRLARGDRRLADIVTLRAVVSLANARIADDDVLPSLATALEGIARPIAIASAPLQRAPA